MASTSRNDSELELYDIIFSKKLVEHCLFEWTIENLSLFPRTTSLTSQTFFIKLASTFTAWTLKFYPSFIGKKRAPFCLIRQNDKGPEDVTVTYAIGLKHGNVQGEEKRNVLFQKGTVDMCKYVPHKYLESLDAVHKTPLIISCEMYMTLNKIPEEEEKEKKREKTKLGTERGTEKKKLKLDTEKKERELDNELLNLVLLSSNFYDLAQNPTECDVVLQVKDLKFSAHKAILAARSSVFTSMLEGECSSLCLSDEDYDHIFNILLYIYSGDFNSIALRGNLAIGLYECAMRYSVNGLAQLLVPTKINNRTTITTERVNFIWIIERYRGYDMKIDTYMTSPSHYCRKEHPPVWLIDLFPQGTHYEPNYANITVRTCIIPDNWHTTVSVSILDENMKELYTKSSDKLSRNCYFGFPQFVEKHKLAQNGEFLRGGKLIINCSIVSIVPKDSCDKISLFQCSSLTKNTYSQVERLAEDFDKLLENGIFSDAVLKAQYKKFFVHKVIMSERAPALALLMTHKDKDGATEIPHVSDQILEAMISFAYTGKLKAVSSDFAFKLYTAAARYDMKSLMKSCSNFVSYLLDINSFCDAIVLSHTHDDKDLMLKCVKFIENNSNVLKSNKWLNLTITEPIIAREVTDGLSVGDPSIP